MSTEHGDPGHGHSPAAWTAVIIMLVARHHRHGRVLVRRRRGWSGPRRRSLVVGAIVGWVLARAGYGVGGSKYAEAEKVH